MQVHSVFNAFEKKYAKVFDFLQVPTLKELRESDARLLRALKFTGALYCEGLLLCAATHKDKTLAFNTAEEQLRKLAAETVDRNLVHPALIKKAESLVC